MDNMEVEEDQTSQISSVKDDSNGLPSDSDEESASERGDESKDEDDSDEKEDANENVDNLDENNKKVRKEKTKKSRSNESNNRKRTFERRNIRKIRSDDAIGDATREAIEAEKARLARVQQRPKNEHIIQSLNAPMIGLYDDEALDGDENAIELQKKRARLEAAHLELKPSDVIIVSEDEDDDLDAEDAKKEMAEKRRAACVPLSKHEVAEEDMDVIDLEDSDSENLNDGGSHVNDDLNVPDELGRVLINVNHPEDEEDLFVAAQIGRALKPHQIGGIRFMYDNVIESTARISQRGFGCILAHAMGLGKTIQVISFVDVAIRLAKFKTVLILVPINTIQNWSNEFERWLPKDVSTDCEVEVVTRQFPLFSITDSMKTFESRANEVAKWREQGGVMLVGYEMFRILVQREGSAARRPKPQKRKKKRGVEREPEFIDVDRQEELAKMWDDTFCALVQPGPDIVIADEGHRIKNEKAEISQKVKNIRTSRRVVLTGYPLQNNLEEYHCMVDFVRPNYLGSKMEFNNMFNRPITNGMCVDSTPEDKRLMHMRSHVLFDRLQGFVQRRSHKVLRDQLPEKTEYVLFLKMSQRQRDFYRLYMSSLQVSRVAAWAQNNPLKAFAVSVKIMNHPDILYRACSSQDKNSIEDDFDGSVDSPSSCATGMKKPRMPKIGKTSNSGSYVSADFQNIFDKENPTWSQYTCGQIQNGPKMVIFFDILEACVHRNEKILAFTQSLSTLDTLEIFLNRMQIPGRSEIWARNVTYYRLDGSTPPSEREKMIKAFNAPEGQASLFLLSTRAGCLGINLTSANRVVVFDASWNPCHDCQAVCRVFRYGQTREVFVYRLIMDNTLERKIYERQVKKQSLSVRVVDETTPDQHFTRQQLEQLMAFEDEDLKNLSAEEILKGCWQDPILLNILVKNHCSITEMPFTHESLLIDKREFHLTSKEKKEAHQEYESARKDVTLSHGIDINLGGGQPMARQSYANFYPTNGSFTNPFLDPRHNPNSTLMKLHKSFETARLDLNRRRMAAAGMGGRFPALAPGPTSGKMGGMFPPGRRGRIGGNGKTGKRGQNDNISVKEVSLPHDLSTPASEGRPSITIPRGTRVKIIQTEKGTYLNHNNFMFALRSKNTGSKSSARGSILPVPPPASNPSSGPSSSAASSPASSSSASSTSYPIPPWMQHQPRLPYPPMYPSMPPPPPSHPFYNQPWPRGPGPLPSMHSFAPSHPNSIRSPYFPTEPTNSRQNVNQSNIDSQMFSSASSDPTNSKQNTTHSNFDPQMFGSTSNDPTNPRHSTTHDSLESRMFGPTSNDPTNSRQNAPLSGIDSQMFGSISNDSSNSHQNAILSDIDSQLFDPTNDPPNSRQDAAQNRIEPTSNDAVNIRENAAHNNMDNHFFAQTGGDPVNIRQNHGSIDSQLLTPSTKDPTGSLHNTSHSHIESQLFPPTSDDASSRNPGPSLIESQPFPTTANDLTNDGRNAAHRTIESQLFPPTPGIMSSRQNTGPTNTKSQLFPPISEIMGGRPSSGFESQFYPSTSEAMNMGLNMTHNNLESQLYPSIPESFGGAMNIPQSSHASQLYPPISEAMIGRHDAARSSIESQLFPQTSEAMASSMFKCGQDVENAAFDGLENLAFNSQPGERFDYSTFNGKNAVNMTSEAFNRNSPREAEGVTFNVRNSACLEGGVFHDNVPVNDENGGFSSNSDPHRTQPLHI